MPREEQLAILRQGVEAWNGWRETNRDEPVDLGGADLRNLDLERFDLSHANLDKADLSGARLERINLSSASLRKANLSYANLDHANLSHADLDHANLAFAHIENGALFFARLRGADLRGAFLKKASLEDVNLRSANLSHAHLEKAVLAFSDCTNAEFVSAFLNGANLTAVNLDKANVSAVTFDRSILWGLLRKTAFNPRKIWKQRTDILLDTTLRCKGVNAACYGSQQFAGFLRGQDFLEEMIETRRGRMICFIWWLLADCGRSIIRWSFWSFAIMFLFGVAYTCLGARGFHLVTLPFNLGSMMYFSVVTFSTLGFGDIIPRTPVALLLTGSEVFLGYLMMGSLISIFATRIARLAR
jgi:uncharacterized protein YjbI with pentapeptide repeats